MVKPTRTSLVRLAPVIAFLVLPLCASSQAHGEGATVDPLAGLRVGQWVELEGVQKGTAPVSCTRLRQLAGDFLDDDWALRGTVARIDSVAREFAIGACRVRLTKRTSFGHPKDAFQGLPDLRVGMLVEVEGTYLDNGILRAAEVDDETDELVRQPGLKDVVKVVGRVRRVDGRKRLVTVMGMDFQVTEKTRLRSVLK